MRLGECNVLEEGLATWFQNEPIYHFTHVQRYIAIVDRLPSAYAEAQGLVRTNLPDVLIAVKTLREEGGRISDITVERLAPLLKDAQTQEVERLCIRFDP